MLDTHCHIDLYQNPTGVAQATNKAGIGTIVVTNLPSAFERAAPHIRQFPKLRLALGLHPQMAGEHAKESRKFAKLASETFYIGEVGLDFSPQSYRTKEAQIASFRFVLETIQDTPKFITLHSRRAEHAVLEILAEFRRTPVVFHWFSGSLKLLNEVLEAGHYLSVNPAMIQSPNGQKIIRAIPAERLLTETDGPFVKVGSRVALPNDVALVEDYLTLLWSRNRVDVSEQIQSNFSRLLRQIKGENNELIQF